MALLARISKDDHAKLADHFKPEYKAAGDEFVLDVTPVGGWVLEDVGGLKATLSDRKKKHEDAQAIVAAYGDLTPEAARAAVEKLTSLDGLDGKEKIEARIASITTQLEAKFKGENAKTAEEREALRAELYETLVDREATAAIAATGAPVDVLLPHVRTQIKVEKDSNGKHRAVVIYAENSNPRMSMKSGSNDPMSIAELVEEFRTKKQFMPLFPGSKASGGGADGSAGRKQTGNEQPTIDPNLPPVERMKIARRQQAAAASGTGG